MISDEYRELNRKAHEADETWGTTADQYLSHNPPLPD